MAEYQILVPPPKRHRTTLIVLVAIVVVRWQPAGPMRSDGIRATPAPPPGRSGGGGVTPTTRPRPLTVVSTVPANGATNVPSNQVVTVHLSAR